MVKLQPWNKTHHDSVFQFVPIEQKANKRCIDKTYNMIYSKIILSAACIATLVLHFPGRFTSVSMTTRPASDPIATHNMLVVGEKTIYLSHLPMFQEKNSPPMPHRYQAILEVGFAKKGSDAANIYAKDRQAHQRTKIYTITPDPFILPMIVSSGGNSSPLRQFNGDIFRGHLEKLQKGEKQILSGVDVTIKRVVYFRQFDPTANKPAQLEYLLFGKGQELFLAHLITAPPDFDQVVAVTLSGHSFSDEELAKGVKIVFRNTKNNPSTRQKEGQLAEGSFTTSGSSAPQNIQVKVNRELYFEEGELQVPPRFGTTPEEKKTGFQ